MLEPPQGSFVLGEPMQQTLFSVPVFAQILEKESVSSGLCRAPGAVEPLLLLAMSLVLPFTGSGASASLIFFTGKLGLCSSFTGLYRPEVTHVVSGTWRV